MKLNSLRRLALAAGLGCVLVAGAPAHAQDLKIGALFPLSGGLALLGDESLRGVQIAVDERNAAGGVDGRKVVLVKADAVDANQAVGEARRLTSVENVTAVVGSYASGISQAATQVTELAGVPYFELGAVADTITGRGLKYVFRSNSTARNFADRTIETIATVVAPTLKVDPKSLKLAIIHEDGPYGTLVAGFQKEAAKRLGYNVVEDQAYSAKTVDLSSLILRLKASGADFVLHTAYQNDAVLFFRQAAAAGYKPRAVVGAGGGYSLTDTAQAVGAAMNAVYDVDFPQITMNPAGAAGLTEFIATYQKKYSMAPRSGHSLAAYAGTKAFLEILSRAKSTDKDKIREAVLAYRQPAGSSATGWGFEFGADGQNKLSTTNLMQWQQGNLVTVYPESVANGKPISGN